MPATASSQLSRVPGLGVATSAQVEPLKWRAAVRPLKVGVVRPTAHASVGDNALTSLSATVAPLATVLRLQLVPLNRSATAPPPSPTATALVADTASTALRVAQLLGFEWSRRSGLGTTAQRVPFQRSTRPLPLPPAAHASVVDSASTPLRMLPLPTAWLGTTDHVAADAGVAIRAPLTKATARLIPA